jgi:hypothetical protein
MQKEIAQAVTVAKKHKVVVGFGVFFTIVLLYLISKKSSGELNSSGESPLDLQYQKLAAGVNVQQSQIQAQRDQTQIAANVAQSQTAAQLEAVKETLDNAVVMQSQEIAGKYAIANLEAETSTTQLHDALSEKSHEADLIAGVYNKRLDNQKTLEDAVIAGASKDKSRSSTGWAQIISALFGEGPQAIAANQPSNVANSAGSILGGIGGIVKGLFG